MTAQSDCQSRTRNFVRVEVALVAAEETAWRLSLVGDISRYSLAGKERSDSGSVKGRHRLRSWYYGDPDICSLYSPTSLDIIRLFPGVLILQPKPLVILVLTQP